MAYRIPAPWPEMESMRPVVEVQSSSTEPPESENLKVSVA